MRRLTIPCWGVVIVGLYMFDAGDVTSGAIIASVILASRAVAPLGQTAGTLTRAQQAIHSFRVLDKIMQVPKGAEAPALEQFALNISAGERVGIIGKIGSGKTTIGRLWRSGFPLGQ